MELPKSGNNYYKCGSLNVCDYCENIGYNEMGKCGRTKVKRRFTGDIGVEAENKSKEPSGF